MTPGSCRILWNNIPQIKTKFNVGGRLVTKEMANEIKNTTRPPYEGQAKITVIKEEDNYIVEAGPWWIGFIELGSATHGSRPFLEPAAERIFRTLVPKMKVFGANL